MSNFESSLRDGLATLASEAVPDIEGESADLADLQWERSRRRPHVMRGLLAAAAIIVVVAVIGVLVASRLGNDSVATTSTTVEKPAPVVAPTTLEPPDAANPAAGTCVPNGGDVVAISFGAGDNVPQPRCAIVHDSQRIKVTNLGGDDADVTLGQHFAAKVPAHGSYTFTDAVGGYLALGVHYLKFSPLEHAEIMVTGDCSAGLPDCNNP